MSPILFSTYLEEIIKGIVLMHFNGKRRVAVGRRKMECIQFADDMVVVSK